MIREQYLFAELTGRIIACAMDVQHTLGNGFQQVIYQRALAIEMERRGLSFSQMQEMKIFYRGVEIGTRRVDFLVEQKIMVEIKAVPQLEEAHLTQAMNYLEAYDLDAGLLLNFGGASLQYKRLLKPLMRVKL